MHDSNGTELKVGDRVTAEFEVAELQSGGDGNYCNVRLAGVKHTDRANGDTPMTAEGMTTCTKFTTLIARPLVCILLVLALCMAGCSGLAAMPGESSVLATQSQTIMGAPAATQPALALAGNADIFDAQVATATLNPFEAWFGPKKIVASAPVLVDLQKRSALAREAAKRNLSPSNQSLALQVETIWAGDTLALLNATPPTTQLVTVAKATAQAKALKARLRATTQPAIITELIAKVPPQFQAWVAEYGPSLLTLSIEQANAAISYLISGNQDAAYRIAISGMTDDQLIGEMVGFTNCVEIPTVQTNADNVAREKAAAQALLTAGVSVLVALLGF